MMCIGIFFVVDEVLISDALPVEQGERYGGHIQYGAHYDYWLSLEPTTAAEAALKSHAYDYYPRGRAVFDVKQNQVKLYIDCCVDQAALSMIRSLLRLPNDTSISNDEHYQCHHCNPMFIDDFEDTDDGNFAHE